MIFTKTRVANFMAGLVIAFTLFAYGFLEMKPEVMAGLAGLAGFAAKHLWDSRNIDEDNGVK